MKYAYLAILEPEDNMYNVYFPDLSGCYSCGESLADALSMATEALELWLAHAEQAGDPIPAASQNVDAPQGATVSLVAADTDAFRRAHSNRAVKKTLTIPEWLNEAAEARSVNFSQVLQEALKQQLGIAPQG